MSSGSRIDLAKLDHIRPSPYFLKLWTAGVELPHAAVLVWMINKSDWVLR